jgi:hypothetical protein
MLACALTEDPAEEGSALLQTPDISVLGSHDSLDMNAEGHALGNGSSSTSAAQAACTVAIAIPTDLTLSDTAPWRGCGASGTGVNSALEAVGRAGGGTVQLMGAGSLLVRPLSGSLLVPSNTTLQGDPARAPYGMTVIGENSAGLNYRSRHDPVIRSLNSSNVKITNLNIEGDLGGSRLGGGIAFRNTSDVELLHIRINGVRSAGVVVYQSTRVKIRDLTLTMRRKTASEPEGGAGVWMWQAIDSLVENSVIDGTEYWQSGPPTIDPRRWPNAAPVMDLVASYGGRRNRFQHNQVSKGNTAGIYIACGTSQPLNCPPASRDSDTVVWDNQIRDMRQNGLDIANADRVMVLTNRVERAEYSTLAMAAAHNGTIKYNRLSESGLNPGSRIVGALQLLWGSSNNIVKDNQIDGYQGNFAVYFRPASDGFGNPTGNVVAGNALSPGITKPYYTSGFVSGNTSIPNSLQR